MTVWMDKTGNGRDCLRNDAGGRVKSLVADCILVRASDGAVTICEPTSLPALSAAQCEMVQHFLDERGMSKVNLFAGQPVRAAPKTAV
uniref:Uncharacterized protein n=1 Tax=uncultured organism TaxID=155900 RepID=Q1EHW7_9ZZZZ|nr:hypothetical protein 10D02-38 [uncultured organism]